MYILTYLNIPLFTTFWGLSPTEWYIIFFMLAAMAVAAIAMPKGNGPAETGFLTGELTLEPSPEGDKPAVTFECRADGAIVIRRTGLPAGLTSGATVALAVTRVKFDISIEERITPADPRHSFPADADPRRHNAPQSAMSAVLDSEIVTPVNTAIFVLPGLAAERYHFKYNSDPTSTYCALTFRNTPGLTATRPLT